VLGRFLLATLVRRSYNLIRLIAELGGQLTVRREHFGRRLNLFLVARGVGGDLRRFVAGETILLHVSEDLILALARSVKILLRISLDLRCAASARRNLVAQLAQPKGQLRLIDGSGELLRLEESAFLERPRGSIGTFSDIEDDGVGVKLRSSIALDGTRCVVLEFCDNELAGKLGRPIATEPRLRVSLQFAESGRDRHAVSLADPSVAAHKSCQRNRLRRAEGRIPPGAMLDGFDCLSIGVLVLKGLPMLNKLLAGLRVLTVREPVELIGANGSSETILFGKQALPFALHGLPLAPIALVRRSEFLLVVVFEFACGKGFRDFKHGQSPNENPL
jgi:hypothetical protein